MDSVVVTPKPLLNVERPTRSRLGATGRLAGAIVRDPKSLVGVVLLAIFVIVGVFAPLIAPDDPHFQSLTVLPLAGPSSAHLLGVTDAGEDIFSQLIWGTRQSLVIAIVAGVGGTLVSVVVGVTAAYIGGTVDLILSLVTDIFLVIPQLPLMIIVAAYFGSGGFWILISVIVVTGWAYGARQLRAQALSLRHREFLEAARIRGERTSRIILFELLPTMTSLIVASFLTVAVYAVLAAAGLQFIGLGDAQDLSWGQMLYVAQNNEALYAGAPLWMIAPGACIALLGAAFALINYGFDEIGNPALRATRRKRGRRAANP